MYRLITPTKDAYITNKVVRGNQAFSANTGKAGSIDIFKLHNISTVNSQYVNEISRGLVYFDLSELRNDYAARKFGISSTSFSARLQLIDVYGGQPTPENFTMIVYPLSKSFDEGLGKDVVYYSDSDVVNFYTSSYSGNGTLWNTPGADSKGFLGSANIDLISSGNFGAGVVNLWSTQSFVNGSENLDIDVTQVLSASLANEMPFFGFRVSYLESIESDNFSYFVKRFGSSQASDPFSRPRLIIKFDDSINSNDGNFTFDNTETLFIKNFVRGNATNLISGSSLSQLTGSNCLLLRLESKIYNSTGSYITYISASQHQIDQNNITGVYSASFSLDSGNNVFRTLLQASGSVTFNTVWSSLDGTVPYSSGSLIVYPQLATNDTTQRKLSVNIVNVLKEYRQSDVAKLKVFIFDDSGAAYTITKLPFVTPSIFLDSVYYSVRDVVTNEVIIPFDTTTNSTKMSNDAINLYFSIHISSLFVGRSYVIDVLAIDADQQIIFKNASPAFRVIS